MPAEYIIDTARGLVFSRGYGVITDDDLIAHVRSLAANPLFEGITRQFTDFSDVTEVHVTSDRLRQISGAANPFPMDSYRAILAPTDVAFGMSRMFEMLRSGENLLVTRSREVAERHLGLAPGESLEIAKRLDPGNPIYRRVVPSSSIRS